MKEIIINSSEMSLPLYTSDSKQKFDSSAKTEQNF